ncbi:ATP-dependent nuclease [Aquihabitans daechungensis]|uniref:ATP-dependent nuclease n=1 Tax=Aquihabitans daechungensis TaxID=1052257 RepID=UPI003BA1EE98
MSGPRITKLKIKGYRSIDEWVTIRFPRADPLVLVGENNAGKSNVLRAMDLLIGDRWPNNYQPEDHEFYGRSSEGAEIKIIAFVEGIQCGTCDGQIQELHWTFDSDEGRSPSYYCQGPCGHTWIKGPMRESLVCMSVGVNRDLAYQLSYNSKWTTLSKLMRKFHDRLVADEGRLDRLKAAYDSLVETFSEVDEFQIFREHLGTSFDDFGSNLQYGLEVDFSAYDPSNFFRSLRLFPQMDGEARTYEELGTGQEQILAMAFAYAYAQAFGAGDGLVLAIEEPEAHLHPLAQQWLARKLRELSTRGVQVVVSTHSPYFIDLASPGTAVFVRKNATGSTSAVQLPPDKLVERLVDYGAPVEQVTTSSVGAFYEAASTYDTLAAFFSRGCILVEGATEQLALPVLLERAGLDLMKAGLSVVPVQGLGSMAKWVRLFRAHEIPVYAIFDTDSDKAAKDRARSLALGNEVLAALGAYPRAEDVVRPLTISSTYAYFDANFEVGMGRMFAEYSALDTEARAIVGDSKQLRARFCARRLPDPAVAPEQWASISELAGTIRVMVPELRSSSSDRTPSPRAGRARRPPVVVRRPTDATSGETAP